MNNSYIINKNTLLIKSTIDKKGVVPIKLIRAGVFHGVEGVNIKPKFVLCNDFLYQWNPYRYEYVDFKLSPALGVIYTSSVTPTNIEERLPPVCF